MSSLIAAIALMIKEMVLFVSYVKNNAFPQPLDDKEEERQINLLLKGDDRARNTLIEHNLRLVAHIVNIMWTQEKVLILR